MRTPEQIADYQRKWVEANRSSVNAKQRERYRNESERKRKLAANAAWFKANPDKRREISRRWYQKNLEVARKRSREQKRTPEARKKARALRWKNVEESRRKERLKYQKNLAGAAASRKRCYDKKLAQIGKTRRYVIASAEERRLINSARQRLWRLCNLERIKSYGRSERAKAVRREINRRWSARNKAKIAAKMRRRRSTPRGIVESRLRGRLNALVKQGRAVKLGTSEELVSCSFEQLIKHLSDRFVEGMNWNNRNDWHIDHIIPCSAFDLLTIEGQKACFHFSNLQPLWAKDNQCKSDKIIPFEQAA